MIQIDIEGNDLLTKLNPSSFVILLDAKGRQFSSHELAAELESWHNTAKKEIAFVIGGAKGVRRRLPKGPTLSYPYRF